MTHAYSRANAGDSLLVDLTLERLERLGIRAADTSVVALDAESFSDLPHVVTMGTPGKRANLDVAVAAFSSVGTLAGAGSELAHTLANADAIIGVGGGYLRTASVTNSVGTAINHLPQVMLAARAAAPSIYLPQSVGPLTGPVGRCIRGALARIDAVHLRDQRSYDLLGGTPQLHRTPDLAVLEMGRHTPSPRRNGDGTALLVARRLAHGGASYVQRLRALHNVIPNSHWVVQAEGSPEKSDRSFYTDIGINSVGTLTQLLDSKAQVVVSVRLHGALQAILAGVPAIHLAYERKSWGAFTDLGLEDWLHNARTFDPNIVAAQVQQLRHDPETYWSAVLAALPRIAEQSDELDESMRRLLHY